MTQKPLPGRFVNMDEASLLSALGEGVVIVCGNERLVRHLRIRYAERQLAKGLEAWSRAQVVSWKTWLYSLYQGLRDQALMSAGNLPLLLNDSALDTLWLQVVSASDSGLLQPAAAAADAREAWELCHSWQIDPCNCRQGSEDAQVFSDWAKAYRSMLERKGWIDATGLIDLLTERLDSTHQLLPDRLVLVGFLEFAPRTRMLLAQIEKAGSDLSIVTTTDERTGQAPHRNIRRTTCKDAQAEALAAANWTRDLLSADSKTRIAIVVHDLQAQREMLGRTFDSVLYPAALIETGPVTDRPWNVSLGRPLAEQAAVHDALMALSWAYASLSPADLGVLLRSPYLGSAQTESDARAELDFFVRDRTVDAVNLKTLAKMVDRKPLASLKQMLSELRQSVQKTPRKALPSAWCEYFQGWLAKLGWPGERTLDSSEYQAIEAFRAELASLALLDVVVGEASGGHALEMLRRTVRTRLFQPHTAEAPVQILGSLEALGLHFDHVWVMGLSDDTWPAKPRPNPFIPFHLQADMNLPHATASRELAFAEMLTTQLLGMADDVVVSNPAVQQDEDLRPSPLITHLPEVSRDTISSCNWAAWRDLPQPGELESLIDEQAPPLAEKTTVSGGASMLQNQSACPFRAFAIHRLNARPLPDAEPGLNAAQRGSLMHRTLELVWRELGSQQRLAAIGDDTLASLVDKAARQAIAQLAVSRSDSLMNTVTACEQQRLVARVLAWLPRELEREVFHVDAAEQRQATLISGLEVNLRIDRVDRLEDGRKVIVDYKTGQASPADWFGERPDQPQLPLYACSSTEPVAAVLLAQLQAGKQNYAGVAENSGIAPGVDDFQHPGRFLTGIPDWQTLLRHWRTTLDALATSFRQGKAAVDPKHRFDTCRYCYLQTLCRIHAQGEMQVGVAADE